MFLLELDEVTKTFPAKIGGWRGRKDLYLALDRVSLRIEERECVALVGESGSGKSTLGQLILGLERPDSGAVRFMGQDWHRMTSRERQPFRKYMNAVFQNSSAALNPRMKAGDIVLEPLYNYEKMGKQAYKECAGELLARVGLDPSSADLYPHQFSGGEQQRLAIARAIAVWPKLIVLDEATSSLDAITQFEILALLKELQRNLNMSYLFITHDMKAACAFADRLLVMEEGRIVDESSIDFVKNLSHPAALKLLDSMLITHPSQRERVLDL
ncbi:dipeptide/oligopeptide/nickel ABC transporter ATP-binding protein [Paenibacillus macerans]|uniref:ABC transporter ATP-binding protein n=1 Tax=Paenibacillus macerans TaxID=44252 RepID=UPI002DBB4C80|nr:dipeptide/oligopeptide/nickel ABC transporter ATP-binding protein [Paenibacillus macerans]MEC0332720.1 dipeptide/oligopeptide/nickel ABC transporter ATP-binding protein [Paenibacillus macerans]